MSMASPSEIMSCWRTVECRGTGYNYAQFIHRRSLHPFAGYGRIASDSAVGFVRGSSLILTCDFDRETPTD